MEAVKVQIKEVKHWTSYRHPERFNTFMPISKAKAFGNENTSNVTFQQGMENTSSMLPQSFYGVERAQGQYVRLGLCFPLGSTY